MADTGKPIDDDRDHIETRYAVVEAIALMDAIEFGELLAAIPAAADERERHRTAVTLMQILRERLNGLYTAR